MRNRLFISMLLVVLGFSIVSAHGDAHLLIQEITKQLETDPENPALYFDRAVLYQSHNDFNHSFLDYQKAKELEPDNAYVDLNLSKLCLANDLTLMALSYSNDFLSVYPEDTKGLVARADANRALGNYKEALTDYTTAANNVDAAPDNYFLLTATLMEQDPTAHEEAIQWFRIAQNKLGDLTSFRENIILLEISRGHFENALVETDLLIEKSARKERWYILKGEVLAEAGHLEAAAQAYHDAKASIQSLSPIRQNTEFVRQLSARIELALTELRN